MKFYGNGLVWDSAKNRLLCEFTKAGVLETEDTYICEKLVSLGYKHDSYLPKSEADKVVEAVHEIMHTLDAHVAPVAVTTTASTADGPIVLAVAPDQPEPVAKPKRGKK